MKRWRAQDTKLRKRILAARDGIRALDTPEATLIDCAELCVALGSDGLRGELTLLRAARALAAFEGDTAGHPQPPPPDRALGAPPPPPPRPAGRGRLHHPRRPHGGRALRAHGLAAE